MDLVSIIIPAYNAEKYIDKCLKSILKQTYEKWEVLIINDGSSDKTKDICQKYVITDPRIKRIDIKNQGVSVARNIGLKHAQGKYIMFVDSDDWIEPNLLEYSVKYIEKLKTDILCWNHINEMTTESQYAKSFSKPQLIFENDEKDDLCYHIIQNNWKIKGKNIYLGMIRCVWGKLFKREVIGNICFRPGMNLAEDALFCYQTFKKAKRISFVNEYLIHYRITDTSANNRFRSEMEKDLRCTLREFGKILDSEKSLESICVYNALVCEFFNHYMKKYIVRKENKDSIFGKYEAVKETLLCDEIRRANRQYRDLSLQDRIILYCIIHHLAAFLLIIYLLKNVI